MYRSTEDFKKYFNVFHCIFFVLIYFQWNTVQAPHVEMQVPVPRDRMASGVPVTKISQDCNAKNVSHLPNDMKNLCMVRFMQKMNILVSSDTHCSSSPCRNAGTCTEELNGFSCACHQNFTGSQCEKSESVTKLYANT